MKEKVKMVDRGSIWKNVKNGTFYVVNEVNIINCTYSNDGEIMVMYCQLGVGDIKFVREIKEFKEKFIKYEAGGDSI